jgi:hypothetical protein
MLTGIILFVGSLFTKKFEYKDAKLPALSNRARKVIRYVGIAFILLSASLYGAGLTGLLSVRDDLPMFLNWPIKSP